MSVLDILIVIAVIAYVIGRQVMGEPLRGKRLIMLPAVLAIIGIVELSQGKGQHFGAADGLCLVISGVVAAAIGVAQGASMRLESRNGYLWGRMPVKALWWWAALLASRGAVTLLAIGMHAHVAESTASILLTLGINRLAQAAVVAPRALSAGVPFAPEKNGRILFGDRFAQTANSQSQRDGWYQQDGSYQAGGQRAQGNGPLPADRPLAPTDLRSLIDVVRSQAAQSDRRYNQPGQ